MSHLTTDYDYDVVVIGAGPAGYVAAIRAAQLGFKTASIDSWTGALGEQKLGGAYVNAGSIACVALLESAKIHHQLHHDLAQHGLSVENIKIDLTQMMARKTGIITQINQQIITIFDNLCIQRIHGRGKLINARQVEINLAATGNAAANPEKKIVSAKYIILASGSSSITPDCAKIDHQSILNTTDALSLADIPKSLGILGAGVIGLELASIWNKLGAKVTLLEAQNHFLPILDQEISQVAYQLYQNQGLDIRLGTRVVAAKADANGISVNVQNQHGKHTEQFDKFIIASGRKPNTENLAAAEAQLLLDENGFVHVDENCGTNLPGVYAIGDLTLLGPMLTHKGIEEGIFVAEHIAAQNARINYNIIPNIVYTTPEIAWIGPTEHALKAVGEPIKTSCYPLHANTKAQAITKTSGMVKLISHADTDKILAVHIIGEHASEIIAEAVLAMEFSASAEDLARTIHAHPSFSTALHEAALALSNRAIHIPPIF